LPETALDCVTWNLHRARGADGRVDPARSGTVLAREVCPPGAADILVLQEADDEAPPHRGLLDLDRLAAETGLRPAQRAPGLRWGAASHGFHGVVVLLGPGIAVEGAALLDLPGRCPRGAVVIDARAGGCAFRLIGTHLSLGQLFRIAQMRVIGQYLARRPERPTLLVGDLNEWRPWAGAAFSPRLLGRRFAGPALATFPAGRPVLPLDRVLVTAPGGVTAARVLDGPGIREASDHRPLAARVALPPA
jgi:endonuclease/exonuclease/phosphatase family metal-dependent hydrolase